MCEKKDPRDITPYKEWINNKNWTLSMHGGLSQKYMHKIEENRLNELLSAIAAHIKNSEPVPLYIMEEYNQLIKNFNND